MIAGITALFSAILATMKAIPAVRDILAQIDSRVTQYRTAKRINKDKKKSNERRSTLKQMEDKEKSDEELKNLHRDLYR